VRPTDMKRNLFMPVLLTLLLVLSACSSDSAASDAAGGDWILQSLVLDGDIVLPLPDRPLELRVDGDQLGGDAGCNSMGGTAVFDDDGSVAITELFWTAMACADASLMEFEAQYSRAFTTFDSWSVMDEQLTMQGPDAQAVYVPKVAPPDLPITGTTWTLDTFLDADVAMNSAGMADVQVVFSDAGVRVDAPCWTIAGSATIEPGGEGNLTTDFTSADPDFTCDDRRFFDDMVDRLSRTGDYRIEENRLTLGTGGNDLVSLRGD